MCTVLVGPKLYCKADGDFYDRFYIFTYGGHLRLGLGDGSGTYLGGVDLVLQSV